MNKMNFILRSFVARCTLLGGLIVAILVLAGSYYFGSLSLAMAYLKGKRFYVSPLVVDLGDCVSGSKHVAKFTVSNFMDQPIRIVGSEEECECLTLDKLPITLDPYVSKDISIEAFVAGQGKFSHSIILYVDVGELDSIALKINTRVLLPNRDEEKN
jgi:hypothetical protein